MSKPKPQIITTKQDGTPCTPYAALTVGPISVRASHLWGTPGVHFSKVGKTALAFTDVPALIEALNAVTAAAPQASDPTSPPTPLPSDATPDVAAIVAAVMAQMAATEAANGQRSAEHARHAAAIAAINGQQ